MGKVHNLKEYKFAKQVTEDIPKILNVLDKITKDLYNYKDYVSVANILISVDEAKTMLTRHNKHYRQVISKKGVTQSEE